jgi:hypothetical protein
MPSGEAQAEKQSGQVPDQLQTTAPALPAVLHLAPPHHILDGFTFAHEGLEVRLARVEGDEVCIDEAGFSGPAA